MNRFFISLVSFILALSLERGSLVAQNNQPPATGVTVQQPVLGVSIDAAGVLTTQLFSDPTGTVSLQRLAAAKQQQKGNFLATSGCRKISLRRLERTLQEHLKTGAELPAEVAHLAGLKRVEFIFLFPEQNDIVIAGPASGWIDDLAGHTVSIDDGQPIVELNELLTALRTFAPGRDPGTWVAVSIDPTAEGLQNYQQLIKSIPAVVADGELPGIGQRVYDEIPKQLGLAQIRVHGIPADSMMAQIMVEADYRMKSMAVGLELPPVKITTFAEVVQGNIGGLQRWWLSPRYQTLTESVDQLSLHLQGQGVELLTEGADFHPQGGVVFNAGKPSKAATTFAKSFTEHYDELAQASAVFAQLQRVVDVLIAATWLNRGRAFDQVHWDGGLLFDPEKLPARIVNPAKQAPCIANVLLKNQTLIMIAGGGVSITPTDAFVPKYFSTEKNTNVTDRHEAVAFPQDANRWWWD